MTKDDGLDNNILGTSVISNETQIELDSPHNQSIQGYLTRLREQKNANEAPSLVIIDDKSDAAEFFERLLNPFFNVKTITTDFSNQLSKIIESLKDTDYVISDINLDDKNSGLEIIQNCIQKNIPWAAMSGYVEKERLIDHRHFFQKESSQNETKLEKIITIYLESKAEIARKNAVSKHLLSQFINDNSDYFVGRTRHTSEKEAPKNILDKFADIVRLYVENPARIEGTKDIQHAMVGVVGDGDQDKKYNSDTVLMLLKPVKSLEDAGAIIEAKDICDIYGINTADGYLPLLENKENKTYQKIKINGTPTYFMLTKRIHASSVRYLLENFSKWYEFAKEKDLSDANKGPSQMPNANKLKHFYKGIIEQGKKDLILWQSHNHPNEEKRTKAMEIDTSSVKKTYRWDFENLTNILNYYKSKIHEAMFSVLDNDETRNILENLISPKNNYGILNVFNELITDPSRIVRSMDCNASNMGIQTGIKNCELQDLLGLIKNAYSPMQIEQEVKRTFSHWDMSTRASLIVDDPFRMVNDVHYEELRTSGIDLPERFDYVKDCIFCLKKIDTLDNQKGDYNYDLFLGSYYVSIRRGFLALSKYIPNQRKNFSEYVNKTKTNKQIHDLKSLEKSTRYLLSLAEKDSVHFVNYLLEKQKNTHLPPNITEMLISQNNLEHGDSSNTDLEGVYRKNLENLNIAMKTNVDNQIIKNALLMSLLTKVYFSKIIKESKHYFEG